MNQPDSSSAIGSDWRTTPMTERRAWLSVGMMTVAAFVVVVNVTMLSPLLRPIAKEFDLTEEEVGRLGTVASIIGAISAVVFAPFMDRFSLRKWVVGQAIILSVISLGSALAPTFAWLMVARAGSATSMMLAKCLSACAEIFDDPARRNRAIGIVVSATTAGTVIGLPIIALVEDATSWRWAYAVLLLPLALLICGYRLLSPEVNPEAIAQSRGALHGYRTVFQNPAARLLFIAQGAIGFAYFGWLTYLGAYVEVDFGGSGRVLGLIFVVAGCGELLANNLVPVTLRRWSAFRVFLVSGFGFAFGLVASGIGTDWLWVVFLTTTFISAFSAAQYVVLSILLLDSIPHARGAVMSLANAAMGIGSALGVATVGFVLGDSEHYATAFRVIALILPLGVIAVLVSTRSMRSEPAIAAGPAH